MRQHPLAAWCCVAVCLASLIGCGKANPRKEVTGMITLKGEPLDQGVIEFHPLGEGTKELPATMEGAVIAKGEYKVPVEQGLVPGKYKVIITSGDGINPSNPDGMPEPSGNFVSKDRIPPAFNSESKVEVEVTSSGPNRFNFDVP
ncbi:MAG: hypothetical protein FJ297_09040 [Planctomycetes bacterium]|nr:hypothetical protein [Planctomycetota bacterium]